MKAFVLSVLENESIIMSTFDTPKLYGSCLRCDKDKEMLKTEIRNRVDIFDEISFLLLASSSAFGGSGQINAGDRGISNQNELFK